MTAKNIPILSDLVEWKENNGKIKSIKRADAQKKYYQKIQKVIGFNPILLIGKAITITIAEQTCFTDLAYLYLDMQWIVTSIQGCKLSLDHGVCDLDLTLASNEFIKVYLAKVSNFSPDEFSVTQPDAKAFLTWIGLTFDISLKGQKELEESRRWKAQLNSPMYGEVIEIDVLVEIENLVNKESDHIFSF